MAGSFAVAKEPKKGLVLLTNEVSTVVGASPADALKAVSTGRSAGQRFGGGFNG